MSGDCGCINSLAALTTLNRFDSCVFKDWIFLSRCIFVFQLKVFGDEPFGPDVSNARRSTIVGRSFGLVALIDMPFVLVLRFAMVLPFSFPLPLLFVLILILILALALTLALVFLCSDGDMMREDTNTT